MDKWWVNGVEQDFLSLNDRGLAYGDGLFETIALRNGECRFLDEHLVRLQSSCRRLGIDGVDAELISRSLEQIKAGAVHATIKIIVTRGPGPRGYRLPPRSVPSIIVGLEESRPAARTAGVKVRYCATQISRNPALAGLKTLNRLEQVIARAEWAAPDIAEGLMSDDRGNVICGTMSNLFVVSGGAVITPELDQCGIRGIMRDKAIAATQDLDLELAERPLARPELESAEEIFLTNSQIGIWPVLQLDDHKLSTGAITQLIMRRLAELGVQECAR